MQKPLPFDGQLGPARLRPSGEARDKDQQHPCGHPLRLNRALLWKALARVTITGMGGPQPELTRSRA